VHPARLLTAAQLQELDRYILNAMEAWGIPGVAVAIVQGDSVMMAKGFGVKELGKPDRVDAHTLFAIGSNTKTTTASLIAMLVDEGKMRWDDPVWKYLPSFRVADPYVSREATIRDLLSHRTDLENDNAVWYGSTLTRAQLIDKLRFLKQESGFRSRYSYNNLMMVVAGEAAARVHAAGDDVEPNEQSHAHSREQRRRAAHDVSRSTNIDSTPGCVERRARGIGVFQRCRSRAISAHAPRQRRVQGQAPDL
jgi:CubicO group peptidase (beta-lactamase class C family)